MAEEGLHPLVEAAAAGELPRWAEAGPARRAHMRRVVDLLDGWADVAPELAALRPLLRAAGRLHDALRDADPRELRSLVPVELRDLPAPILHGPAAAARLREEGVEEEALLEAVAWHTLGHPELGTVGRFLYLADFLEPGRDFRTGWRRELRERLPEERDAVLRTVVRARIEHLLERRSTVRRETVAFWNRLVGEAGG